MRPAGGDAYILRDIIHDWEDDQAVAILTNCRRAMAAGARVLLVERYLATDLHEAFPVLHADLEMLVTVGGHRDAARALGVRAGSVERHAGAIEGEPLSRKRVRPDLAGREPAHDDGGGKLAGE